MQPLPKAKTYPTRLQPLTDRGTAKPWQVQSLWRLLRLLRLLRFRCLSFQPRCRCLTRPTSSARDLQLDARGAQKGRDAWLSHRPLHGSNVRYFGTVCNMKSHEISRAILQVTNPTIRELSKHCTIIHNHSQNRCLTCPTHLSLHISWDRSSGLEGSIFKKANTLTCLSNFIQRNLPKRSKNIKDLTISPSHHNSPPVTGIFRNFFVVFVCVTLDVPFKGIRHIFTKPERSKSFDPTNEFTVRPISPVSVARAADLNIPKTFINTADMMIFANLNVQVIAASSCVATWWVRRKSHINSSAAPLGSIPTTDVELRSLWLVPEELVHRNFHIFCHGETRSEVWTC